MENHDQDDLEQLPVPPFTDGKPWAIVIPIEKPPRVFGTYGTRGEAELEMSWLKKHTLFSAELRRVSE